MVSLKITDSIVYVTFKVGNEGFKFKQAYDYGKTYSVDKYRLLMYTLYRTLNLNIRINKHGEVILEGEIPDKIANTLIKLLEANSQYPNFGTSLIIEVYSNAKTVEEFAKIVEEKTWKHIKKIKREEERRKLIEELYGKFEEHKGYYLLKYRDRKAVIVEIPKETFLGIYDTEYQTLIVHKGKLYIFGRTRHIEDAKYFASKQIVKKRIVRDEIYEERYESNLVRCESNRTRQIINETIGVINEIEDENLRKELLNALNTRLEEEVAKTI